MSEQESAHEKILRRARDYRSTHSEQRRAWEQRRRVKLAEIRRGANPPETVVLTRAQQRIMSAALRDSLRLLT